MWLAGKESACNVGDLGLIPGLGRSPGEREATHCSILAYSPWGHKESNTIECLSLSTVRRIAIMTRNDLTDLTKMI